MLFIEEKSTNKNVCRVIKNGRVIKQQMFISVDACHPKWDCDSVGDIGWPPC